MKNYHKNPRQIKDKQFRDLRAWLAELGDLSGIVHDLNTDEVISGNQRMRAIDIAKCEIVLMDGPHDPDAQGTVAHGYVIWQGAKYNYRQVRWTPEQCEKANIVANKAGGSWDFDVLANEWEKEDLLEWGFELEELGMLPDDDAPEDPGAQIDRAEELREKWGVETGQLWQLGEHRLVCGDCTDAAVVARVMGEERAHLLMTSPPYWVGKDYETQKTETEIDDFVNLFVPSSLLAMSDDYSRIVINTGTGRATALDENETRIILLLDKYINGYLAFGWKLRTLRHWIKGGGQPRPRRPIDDICYSGIEYLLTFYKAGALSRGQNRVSEPWPQQSDWTDITGDRQENEAGFAIEIPRRFIVLYTLPDELVFEPFCGNGTTLIACERLGRRCRAIEISPAYCAVAIERWVVMTGGTPVLLEPALQ